MEEFWKEYGNLAEGCLMDTKDVNMEQYGRILFFFSVKADYK